LTVYQAQNQKLSSVTHNKNNNRQLLPITAFNTNKFSVELQGSQWSSGHIKDSVTGMC